MLKEHVAAYARPYINTEYQFPESGTYGINWWPLVLSIDFDNLVHHPVQLDFKQTHFDYVPDQDTGDAVVFFEMPMI